MEGEEENKKDEDIDYKDNSASSEPLRINFCFLIHESFKEMPPPMIPEEEEEEVQDKKEEEEEEEVELPPPMIPSKSNRKASQW